MANSESRILGPGSGGTDYRAPKGNYCLTRTLFENGMAFTARPHIPNTMY